MCPKPKPNYQNALAWHIMVKNHHCQKQSATGGIDWYKPKTKRKLGFIKGQILLPDNFLDEDEEINALFYGEN
jgi:hypothetical protein